MYKYYYAIEKILRCASLCGRAFFNAIYKCHVCMCVCVRHGRRAQIFYIFIRARPSLAAKTRRGIVNYP